MFNFFSKAKKTAVDGQPSVGEQTRAKMLADFLTGNRAAEPTYVRCYTAYGQAVHIRQKDDAWVSLCGSEIVKDGSETIPANVMSMIPRQHSTFFFCGTCASMFTGISAAEIVALRSE